MPDIAYVCMSDLHFGAENSILTKIETSTVRADLTGPSPAIAPLLECLHSLISRNEAAAKPKLILNGDILEFALATDEVAATVFGQFAAGAFGGTDPVFDDTVFYLPGNHDHHSWETARERQYREYIERHPRDEPLNAPWHTTKLFQRHEDRVEDLLLETLLKRFAPGRKVTVRSVYPNLGLTSETNPERCVVFHHGHFVESLYRLMSMLKDLAFPERDHPDHIWDWEAENFAWIDFFWSTLGRSGAVGTDIGLAYEMLQSGKAMNRLAANISTGLQSRLKGPAAKRWIIGESIRLGLQRFVIPKVTKLERSNPGVALTERGEQGLADYLDGPLRLQLRNERNDTLPSDLTFVFGHTHKPFEQVVNRPLFPAPVEVLNTGGWVVDDTELSTVEGAAVILLDESLAAVSLRMYNQASSPDEYRVRLEGRDSPFKIRLQSMVEADSGPWKEFSLAVAALVTERQGTLARVLAAAEQGRRL